MVRQTFLDSLQHCLRLAWLGSLNGAGVGDAVASAWLIGANDFDTQAFSFQVQEACNVQYSWLVVNSQYLAASWRHSASVFLPSLSYKHTKYSDSADNPHLEVHTQYSDVSQCSLVSLLKKQSKYRAETCCENAMQAAIKRTRNFIG